MKRTIRETEDTGTPESGARTLDDSLMESSGSSSQRTIKLSLFSEELLGILSELEVLEERIMLRQNPFAPTQRGYYLWVAWARAGIRGIERGPEPLPGEIDPNPKENHPQTPFERRFKFFIGGDEDE